MAASKTVLNPAAALPAAELRRRVARGSAWVFAGKVAASSMGVVVSALLARLLPHGGLGVYFLVFSTANFASTVSALGLDRAVVRLVAASRATGEPQQARHATVLVFRIGAASAFVSAAVLVLGLGQFLADDVFHSAALAGVVVGLAAWLVAMTIQSLVAETFRGFQRFGLATVSDGLLANVLLLVALAVVWASGANLTVSSAVATSVGATSVAIAVMGVVLIRRVQRLPRGGEGVATGDVMRIAWPLLISNAGTYFVGWGIDLWIVGAFLDKTDVALYGAAAKLVFLVAVPNLIILQVVPPIVAQLHAQGRTDDLEYVLRSVATLALVPAAIMLAAFLTLGGPIMSVTYGHFYRNGASVLAILCLARMVGVAAGPCANTLMMTGHQRTMMWITVGVAVASVASGIVMVHLFGTVGVASSTCLGQILQNGLALVFVHRRIGIWTLARPSLDPLRDAILTGREAVDRRRGRDG
jgi:O-antigen/teichoic acid export membrane protein